MKARIAYKLFRERKDGSLGSLFINRTRRIPLNVRLQAEAHRTEGYAYRPGWHVCPAPHAPHLSPKGRVWCRVRIENYTEHRRPASQGGVWYTARHMTVLEKM